MLSAGVAIEKLYAAISEYKDGGSINLQYKKRFSAVISDDINTAQAIALLWELVKDDSISSADKKETLFDFDNVLGLDLKNSKKYMTQEQIPKEIAALAEAREAARKARDFARADEIREEILKAGYEINDTSSGPIVKRSS